MMSGSSFTVVHDDEGEVKVIKYVERADWDGPSDPCPDCGEGKFSIVNVTGGLFAQRNEAVVQLNEYESIQRPLLARAQCAMPSSTSTRCTISCLRRRCSARSGR